MFKDLHWKRYIKYGAAAAILFCIPVFFFLRDSTWSQSWLLYLGNALFMVLVASFLLMFNRRRHENASSTSMVVAGVIVTVLGIIISCLICFLLLSTMIPGLFHAEPDKVLTGEPANSVPHKSHGVVYMVLFSAAMVISPPACLYASFSLSPSKATRPKKECRQSNRRYDLFKLSLAGSSWRWIKPAALPVR